MAEKISVIVPIYKVEKYLSCCLDSIINQTYDPLEIILVDDGSPDSCGKICEEYAKKDHRIKVIHKENGGLSDARNVGLEAATGDWIVFVDSDDFIHVQMIEQLWKTSKDYDADMVWCDFVETEEDGTPRWEAPGPKETVSSFECNEMNKQEAENMFYTANQMSVCMVAWNKLYKKTLFGDHEQGVRYPKGKIFEDGYTTYRLIYQAQKIAHIKIPLYYYRQREQSIMRENADKNYVAIMECGSERMQFYLSKGEQELYQKEISLTMYSAIRLYEKIKDAFVRSELKRWYRIFYTEHFVKQKWPLAKRIRMKSFLISFGLYKFISGFEGIYNKITKKGT